MLIEIFCRHCGKVHYDAPLDWKRSDGCPECGSQSISVTNDESYDPPDGMSERSDEEDVQED